MKKLFTLGTILFCGAMVWGSPYGKALQKARQVAGRAERRNAQATAPAPRRQTAEGAEFKQLYIQIGEVARLNRGVLPGPAGIAGLKKTLRSRQSFPRIAQDQRFQETYRKELPLGLCGRSPGTVEAFACRWKFPCSVQQGRSRKKGDPGAFCRRQHNKTLRRTVPQLL